MNKRLAVGLILGMSLLFYVIIYIQKEDSFKAEAWANAENITEENNASELADQPGQSSESEGVTGRWHGNGTVSFTRESDPSSTPNGTASFTEKPDPSSTPNGTDTPQPTSSPMITGTPAPTKSPGKTNPPAPTQKPTPTPILKGWNKTAKGKKYYILKNGKRAKGYKTIDGADYYFNTNGYAITKQWKYVKLNGKNYKLYFGKNGKRKLDVSNQLSANTTFRIEVNLSKNMVMIYAKDGNKGYTIPVKAMICSVGMPGHRTITGTYYRLRRAGSWHVLRYNSVGQYCTRISGPYLFHSVVYTRYGDKYSLQKAEYKKLGKSASHGCIRLQVEDAKWIYDRAYRCHVSLYHDKKAKYPLAKPKAKKIGKTAAKRYYDPTDPNVSEN